MYDTIIGMPIRPTNITRAHTTYSNVASNVTLSWNLPTVGRVDMYHVNVSYEPNMLMNYSTNTPAVTVEGIPYDQQVIVSITSVNCYSDSERAYFNINISETTNKIDMSHPIKSWLISAITVYITIHKKFVNNLLIFYVGRCNKTAPKDGLLINDSLATVNSIPGEEIMFTCNPGYAPQVLNTAICKEDGMWDPDPTRTMCLIGGCLPQHYYTITLCSLIIIKHNYKTNLHNVTMFRVSVACTEPLGDRQ